MNPQKTKQTVSRMLSLSLLSAVFAGLSACNAVPNRVLVVNQDTSGHNRPGAPDSKVDQLASFSYSGETGPEHWGALAAEFEKCGSGTVQSPINIKSVNVAPIVFDYQQVPLTVVNNGHTIQVNYPTGSTIKIGAQEFELLQFHFHTPSENRLAGKAFEMEMHLVHKDAQDQLSVVGVFFEKGAENSALKLILDHLPKVENKPETFANTQISAADLLPVNQAYSGFEGSLTTPPCSESVEWRVMRTPLQLSEAQLATFRALFHNNNARPIQALNGREVKAST